MENKQKVKLVVEIDRSEYDAFLFLADAKSMEEEELVWNEMLREPIPADLNVFGGEARTMKMMLIEIAILSVRERVEKLRKNN